jgi:Mg-chelatase subunit ChlD/capsular polysaccharide biosynthesis protein/uncharacterized membrane protein YgcG
MNPDLPPISREELEVRLTALLLDELPPAEAEAVRALAANDAELAQLLARLEQAIQLVREGLTIPGEAAPATPPLSLTAEKRAQLLAHFQAPPAPDEGARTSLSAGAPAAGDTSKPGHAPADKTVRAPGTVTPEAMGVKRLQPKPGRYHWVLNAAIAVTALAVLAGLFLPALGTARHRSRPSQLITGLPARPADRDSEPQVESRRVQAFDLATIAPPPPPPEAAVASAPAPAAREREQLRMKIALPEVAADDAGITLTVEDGASALYSRAYRVDPQALANAAGRPDLAPAGQTPGRSGGASGRGGYAAGGYGGGVGGGGGFGSGGSGGGREGWEIADLSDLKRDGAAQSEWQAPLRGDRLPAPPAGAITAQTAPAEKPPTVMLGDALVGSDFVAPPPVVVNGLVDVAGGRRAGLRSDPASATPAGPKSGGVAAGEEFAFGAAADRRALGLSSRSGAAGQPIELIAKAQTTDEFQLGFVADPSARQSAVGRDNAPVTHFFADTDLPSVVTATRKLELNRIASPADAEALGRQPARSASSSAAAGVAGAATASVPAQNPGGIRLPMPTLKGTPEDRPTGGNIEGLAESEAKAKAQWDTLAANVAQPAATPSPAMAPEMQGRFARRYGLPPSVTPPPATPAPADSKQSVPNLGNVPMLGALFKGKAAEVDGDQGGKDLAKRPADDFVPAKDANQPTAPSFAGTVVASTNFYQFARGTPANNAWFDDGLAGEYRNRSDSQRGRAIVLPPAEPQAERFLQDGKLLYESGRLEEARDKFARAQAVAPGNAPGDDYGSLAAAAQTWKEVAGKQVTAQAEVTQNWGLQLAQPPVTAGRGLGLQEAPKEELRSLSSALGARPQSAAAPMEKKLAEAEVTDLSLSTSAFAAKKRELEDAIRFRNILSLKTLSESTDRELPKSAAVALVDAATPAEKPSTTLLGRAARIVTGAPDQYQSTARIRVERNTAEIDPVGGKNFAVSHYDPYFIQTEQEVLQSRAVLDQVAKSLKLDEKWAKKYGENRTLKPEETYALLKDKLAIQPDKNTSLLGISVKSDDAEEAAQIANQVAREYQKYRTEQHKQMSMRGMQALTGQFAKQDQQIAQLEEELEQLRAAAPTSQPSDPPPPPKPPANAPIPQPEVASAENAFSTFSLNVADVSFKLAAASLEQGVLPEVASLRSEEFLNAFDYRDAEPAPGAPVAFAWERARDPFAHNRDFLRFSLKTAASGRQAGRPLNLVLLLDNSGSMERADRVQIIQQAMRVLAGQLQAQDRISVVTFARTPRLWLDAVPGDKAGEAVAQIAAIVPQGGTDLGGALQLGYDTARRHYLPGGLNRVVLLTDGAANLGDVDPDSLKRKVEAHRQQGIALDCFGIGWDGYNDDLLENLSRNGDGRYGFVNTPEAAATEFAAQLAGALQVAASDVKVQVEFNPARVTHWRQIGYAKHQLTKEQFRDNAVDAAEIAAQEAGNGLYVIETNPQGQGPLATVRVRYKVPGTADYREIEWSVPYTGNAVSLAQAGPALRLAVAATGFSEWLAGSPFAAEITPDRLLGLLGGVPEAYGADERPKKLEWMIRQAKSLSGK